MAKYAFASSTLTVVTAVIHLYLGLTQNMPMFIVNGLGYLALLGALTLPLPQLAGRQKTITWLLMGFAAVTLVLWLILGARNPLAYFDKLVEALLIIILWMQIRDSKVTA
ncbi:MAG: hypothetical protein EXR62_06535 [Chloroflexi bacterium]|nr:hypothetical protein [Chloroflexota bacterium]